VHAVKSGRRQVGARYLARARGAFKPAKNRGRRLAAMIESQQRAESRTMASRNNEIVTWTWLARVCIVAMSALALAQEPPRPRFEDFPATAKAPAKPVLPKLSTRSERMFRTRLTEGAAKPANFAGHLRSVLWGCGSNCGAAAFINLEDGSVLQPPLAIGASGWERWMLACGMFEGSGFWGRLDSRLLIIRCTIVSESNEALLPDTYYFVWEPSAFRLLSKFPADKTRLPDTTKRLD
jgi:hypothetical protein